jgi:hypothetical protein
MNNTIDAINGAGITYPFWKHECTDFGKVTVYSDLQFLVKLICCKGGKLLTVSLYNTEESLYLNGKIHIVE